jgi:hypothetical protein
MMHENNHKTEAHMLPVLPKPSIHVSDSIHFKSIDTGGQSVGNGGDGSFSGAVISKPTLTFDPTNKADGAHVNVTTGDHVSQKASWDADAIAKKAHDVNANSNGDQKSYSGYDTSKVYANTTADQTNKLWVDMHQEVMAGIGGNGGDNNAAMGGEVDFHFSSSI